MRCRGDVDLNRDFPDPLRLNGSSLRGTGREQAETKALMQWTSTTHFVASVSLHEVSTAPPCRDLCLTHPAVHCSSCWADRSPLRLRAQTAGPV